MSELKLEKEKEREKLKGEWTKKDERTIYWEKQNTQRGGKEKRKDD